jgi:hypothetical protein
VSLSPGTRLGPYEITSPLGVGGMGEVYRATDTKLKREVAIKVLPEGLARDPERLARFEREAQLLASLNHPHIAAIHGIEDSTPVKALVMELVEGATLQDRMEAGPVPVDEALPLAQQIAEALEAAHEKGIVHRDLKPANVKITPDGAVKVLDFGLAKALDPAASGSSPDLSHSPTISYQATAAGIILGTAAYMAPEQARGSRVDKRADIWAFGVVLWEMLAGRRLFRGETVSDTLAGVLKNEIDFSDLPDATPAPVRRLLRRCLERNPKNRLRDIGDAALELADARAPHPEEAPVSAPPAVIGGRSARVLRFAIAAAAVAAAIAVWALLRGSRGGLSATSVSFERKTFDREVIYGARFLPHGRGIVYSAARSGNVPELFLLSPGAAAPKKLGGEGTNLLSVSDDGELAVLTGATYVIHRVLVGTLARMTLDGSPRPLVDGVRDADWGPDGKLAIVRRVGNTDRLEYPIGTVLYRTSGYVSEPRVSADGREVAFLDHQWWLDDRGPVKLVDRSGKVRAVTDEYAGIEGLCWSPDGRKLFFSGDVTGGDYQPQAVAISGGKPTAVLSVPGSFVVLDAAPNGDWLAVQQDERHGVVAHVPGGGPGRDLSWLDLSWMPWLSPDGETLLFTNGHGGSNYASVTRGLDGPPITTLGDGQAMGYSPDGRWVAAKIANPPSVAVYPTGAGSPRVLERGSIENYADVQWFPDGSALLVGGNERSRPARDYRQRIAGGPPEPVTPEGITGSLRPDGTAILALDGRGTWALYPLGKGAPTPVRGLEPDDDIAAWSRDGSKVFVYRFGDVPVRVERVDLATGERTPALTIAPEERAGLVSIWFRPRVYEPGQGYAYNYGYQLSKLYVVHGIGR